MRFLVLGDAMVDTYWSGRIGRLNPEKASAPLVHVSSKREFPGGAANVAKNLEAWGHKAVLKSGVGSVVKHRVIDPDGVICRFDEEEELTPLTEDDLPKEDFDAIVVSDYGKGSIVPGIVSKLVSYGRPIFVDTKSCPDPWVSVATCLFPNDAEFAKYKRDYANAPMVLIKLGRSGARLKRLDAATTQYKSEASGVRNPTGAGDTVLAAFAMMFRATYISGAAMPWNLAATFAMQMAAAAVASPFTHAPSPAEVFSMFPHHKGVNELALGEKS